MDPTLDSLRDELRELPERLVDALREAEAAAPVLPGPPIHEADLPGPQPPPAPELPAAAPTPPGPSAFPHTGAWDDPDWQRYQQFEAARAARWPEVHARQEMERAEEQARAVEDALRRERLNDAYLRGLAEGGPGQLPAPAPPPQGEAGPGPYPAAIPLPQPEAAGATQPGGPAPGLADLFRDMPAGREEAEAETEGWELVPVPTAQAAQAPVAGLAPEPPVASPAAEGGLGGGAAGLLERIADAVERLVDLVESAAPGGVEGRTHELPDGPMRVPPGWEDEDDPPARARPRHTEEAETEKHRDW